MSDFADRLLSDMSKVQGSSKGRSSAKSRAKQENAQQARVIKNFLKAVGNKSIGVFVKKMKSLERSLRGSKVLNQRVTIKSSYTIEKNTSKAKKLIKAHVSYITRNSAGDSLPFNDNNTKLTNDDLKAFINASPAENEKTFRFIISPEKAKDFENEDAFKKFIQDCMKQMSKDLPGNPEFIYAANIHYDTDNPHCHVLLKGLSKTGEDITIPKEYIKATFRERAEEIATTYLGNRTMKDIQDAKLSEITAKRFTSLDFAISQVAINNVFDSKTFDKATKTQEYRLTNYLIPRLDFMCKIGLATKNKTKYSLDPNYKRTLQEMPLNLDIIKKLATLKKTHFISGLSKYDAFAENKTITGIIADKGFYNEEKQLAYVIIVDANKKSYFVKFNKNSEIEGNESSIGNTVELVTRSFVGKDNQEHKFPALNVLSRLSVNDQINHSGITYLDKCISLNNYKYDTPTIYQQQIQEAVEARINKLVSENKMYLIDGKNLFSKTYWLEAEKQEHSGLEAYYNKLTYTRLAEKETFVGRVIDVKQFGNETHAVISNGKQFIVIPVKGRINKYNDKTTPIQVTMAFDRKGFSAALYTVKPIMQKTQSTTNINQIKP